MSIKLQEISLQGFRAYLAKQSFDLRPGKSLAVFAPNARGKSSLVDAIEVFFSETGSLARLGQKKSDTKAGPEALEHVLAEKQKIVPSVRLMFRDPPALEYGDDRQVRRPPAARSKTATDILNGCRHDFVIRGHELRAFVESHTPEERYGEVSKWFGLTPLVTTQKNLRTLRKKVTEIAGDQKVLAARQADVSKATGGAVDSLEEADIVAWVNSVLLAALDKSVNLGSMRENDSGYLKIKERKKAEDDALGVTALDQLMNALSSLADEKDGTSIGYVFDFRVAVDGLRRAEHAEANERAAAEQSVFAEVWEKAQQLLSDSSLESDQCPVCDTPFENTPHCSRSEVTASVTANLALLAAYNVAADTLGKARIAAQQSLIQLKTAAQTLEILLRAGKYDEELLALQEYFKEVEAWKPADAHPDDAKALVQLKELVRKVFASAKGIRERQGEATFAGAVARISELRRIASSIRLAKAERAELLQISESLEGTALRIDRSVAAHVASLLNGLRDEINRLFLKIQGPSGAAVMVGLEPPDPDAKGKLKLGLVIDFADNRKGVNPAGYLSDSQVHTIALSLRLAAIKLFNPSFRFIVLDDVVTSYDADHRKAVAAMIAEAFAGFQFMIVTHDERFFRYLKEHMPAGEWTFKQITEIEKGFGPRFLDHKIGDEIIDTKLSNGQHAANEIRQAEEEWLLAKAREFGISLRIRDVDRPYAFDRGEVATGIATFLKGLGLKTPALPGFTNSFWISLQAGEVENFGSHFQENPNASGSIGDELVRWNEFKQFRELFRCSCGNTRYKRPKVNVKKPLCDKCETPFTFREPEGSTA
jgi:energy-coupling factor transporter ATP-binding protein EcfA2